MIEGILALVGTLVGIGAKLLAGKVTPEQARAEVRQAFDAFDAKLDADEAADKVRDAATDDKIDKA